MISKYLPYIIAILCLYIAGLHIYISKKKCPTITKTVEKVDTFYVGATPLIVESEPINTVIEKPIYIHKEGKTDTFLKYVYQKNNSTFTAIDTAYNDSLFVAIVDSGNCSGIQSRRFSWGGKRSIIQKTITNNIATPPPVFSAFGGVSNQIKNKSVTDIQPNAMLMYKGKFGIEYGYGLMTKSHNVGLKFKIK